MSNSYGKLFRITTFGESHGAAVGVTVDGCPAGLEISPEEIQHALDRRRPGQSDITTPRKEEDRVTILSGIFDGRTTGTPIALVVNNKDQHSHDYSHVEHAFRPSHADYTYTAKYGLRDFRGGGRSSARETVARVAAGALAAKLLLHHGITVQSYVSQVGTVKLRKHYSKLDLSKIDSNKVRCPDGKIAARMIGVVEEARDSLDTVGGVVSCVVKGVPAGLGEPVFDKLHAELGKAMLSVNAVKGFEYGSGFEGVKMRGSEHNDEFYTDAQGQVRTRTNNSGGIQGGISNGQDIYFSVAFKPVATILQPQTTINDAGEEITLQGKGRHDPCVLPRAVPIVDAMAALVIADFLLRQRVNKL
ncbi:chorismate synthase [Pontibacter akesuensis]|uniref:Chorismate synthase n=1 Tax=Pontibacter akesuensis TaxID=388950 RepID=A0A1I7JEY5_9BACT|nr:chorismate synthase [Pontibacter akesuensis]GHA70423.1 chorismate synthase [Pontibacter akesuensis]SFU83745.1 chorismate synthase [Pontibacter akesuensis]